MGRRTTSLQRRIDQAGFSPVASQIDTRPKWDPAGVSPFRIATQTDDVVADVGAGLDWIGRGGTDLKLFCEGRIGDLVSEQSGGVKASVPF